jgi:hypothetical protein
VADTKGAGSYDPAPFSFPDLVSCDDGLGTAAGDRLRHGCDVRIIPLIYLNDPKKYTVSLALRSFPFPVGDRWNRRGASAIHLHVQPDVHPKPTLQPLGHAMNPPHSDSTKVLCNHRQLFPV